MTAKELDKLFEPDVISANVDLESKDIAKPVDIIDNFLTFLTHKKTKSEISSNCVEFEIPDITLLPPATKRLYGCLNCEWRGTMKCPFVLKKKGQAPAGGICMKRQVWLSYLGGDWDKRPKLAEWQERFHKNRLAVEAEQDLHRLNKLKTKLEDMEQAEEDEEKIVVINGKRAEAKKEWLETMKLLLPAESRQVEREMPKKIEIDHKRRITPMDVAELLKRTNHDKDTVIDADFEKVDE